MSEINSLSKIKLRFSFSHISNIYCFYFCNQKKFDYIPADLIKEITSNYAIPVKLMSDLFQILTNAFLNLLLARS